MNIIEVNCTDLAGRIFNGYDLHLTLNQLENVDALQYVLYKTSLAQSVIPFYVEPYIQQRLLILEKKYSMSQLLAPYGRELIREKAFERADVVHLHIIHNDTISILDLPEIMEKDNVAWTIHDPWLITGNCVHPLRCEKWRSGCSDCENRQLKDREMHLDKASSIWRIKQKIYSQINPYIVVPSNFMKQYLLDSPLTAHWTRITQIPFGVKLNFLEDFSQKNSRIHFGIPDGSFVIGFRNDARELKGCQYIFEALESLRLDIPVHLLVAGSGDIPENLRKRYSCTGPEWFQEEEMLEFYRSCDVFLMPSLAESFGLMAIEAMACETVVICFESTVVEELTGAPDFGIAVKYQSAEAIVEVLEQLINHGERMNERKLEGKDFVRRTYSYDAYVKGHLKLYQEIVERNERILLHEKSTDNRSTL